jgi:hypothetical protein
MYRSLNARLRTRSINNHIRTKPQLALFDQILGVFLRAHSRTLEASIRRILERKVEAFIVDIHCDDFLRAVCLSYSAAK